MAINTSQRGFALLTAVIIMSLMLSFGLAIGSLAYKQLILSSGAVSSQYAFYAADSAIECALYADQQSGSFEYPIANPNGALPAFTCDNSSPVNIDSYETWSAAPQSWTLFYRMPLDNNKRCADLTIYKVAQGTGPTKIYAQGYDSSCAAVDACLAAGVNCNSRLVSRGIYYSL